MAPERCRGRMAGFVTMHSGELLVEWQAISFAGMNSSRVSPYRLPGFATPVFIPARPFLLRCSKHGYEGLGVIRPTVRPRFKLLRLMCGFVLGLVQNFIMLPTVNGYLVLVLHSVCWLYHMLLLYMQLQKRRWYWFSHFSFCTLFTTC